MDEEILSGGDRFDIDRELANTLQGRIYAGTDLLTGKKVVIKEAWKQLVASGRSREGHRVPENFLHEREVVMRLTNVPNCSPGMVRGIAQWDDADCHYYAMEFCEGELFEYINETHTKSDYQKFVMKQAAMEQKPMKKANKWVKKVAKMFRQICEAVAYLHSLGYCHLDLSLENTMIADFESMQCKVIDLGLATKLKHKNWLYNHKVGKLQYMSPETYSCGNRTFYDARKADVYCLGVMLFMMLTGAPPYPMPSRRNNAFRYLIEGHLKQVLAHWKRLGLCTEEALDLLIKIFRYEDDRISLDEILKHPFLQNLEESNAQTQQQEIEIIHANDTEEEEKQQIQVTPNNSVEKPPQRINDVNSGHSDQKSNPNWNDECVALLKQWGLMNICDIMHKAWADPNEWHKICDINILKWEIGLDEEDARRFIKKHEQHFNQKKEVAKIEKATSEMSVDEHTERKSYSKEENETNGCYQQKKKAKNHSQSSSHSQSPPHYQQQYNHQQQQQAYIQQQQHQQYGYQQPVQHQYQQQHGYNNQYAQQYNHQQTYAQQQHPPYHQQAYQPQPPAQYQPYQQPQIHQNDYNNPYFDPNLVNRQQQQQQQRQNNHYWRNANNNNPTDQNTQQFVYHN